MICAEKFLDEASNLGFNFYTGVPCSFLKPLINASIEAHHLSYIPAVNEGDAVGIAAGVYLGGGLPVVMFQNSGAEAIPKNPLICFLKSLTSFLLFLM